VIGYLKAGLVTAVALFAILFTFNTVRADDKKTCVLCDEVKVVLESARCDKCQADKQCEVCAKHVKDMEKKYACSADKDGKSCEVCEKAIAANKCKFCAAKIFIVQHTFCCAKCEKAGEEKAEKCKPCLEARKPIDAIKCPDKNCPNAKK
jgi:hypothetical protein